MQANGCWALVWGHKGLWLRGSGAHLPPGVVLKQSPGIPVLGAGPDVFALFQHGLKVLHKTAANESKT